MQTNARLVLENAARNNLETRRAHVPGSMETRDSRAAHVPGSVSSRRVRTSRSRPQGVSGPSSSRGPQGVPVPSSSTGAQGMPAPSGSTGAQGVPVVNQKGAPPPTEENPGPPPDDDDAAMGGGAPTDENLEPSSDDDDSEMEDQELMSAWLTCDGCDTKYASPDVLRWFWQCKEHKVCGKDTCFVVSEIIFELT